MIAEVLRADKAARVAELQQAGGQASRDGRRRVNDAHALAQAELAEPAVTS